jgi:hypothetical protein
MSAAGALSGIADLKKSVGMLQAYGEFQRFVSLSKKFMKDRGISLGKKSQYRNQGISLNAKAHHKRPRKKSQGTHFIFDQNTLVRQSIDIAQGNRGR